MNNELLFVYGTLLTADNEFGKLLTENCSFYKYGKFKGELYDVGEYRGAILNAAGDGYVHGCIYKLASAEVILKLLDEYEGISANDEPPHEYIREMVAIETENEPVSCWVYLYNWPVEGLVKISSGNYLQYKMQ